MSTQPVSRDQFCWLCYRESVLRFIPGLDRPLRLAVLAEARRYHSRNGVRYWSPAAHRLHPQPPDRNRRQAA